MTDSTHEQMKKENAQLRKAIMETNKNYVEVVNENLALKRELEKLRREVYNGSGKSAEDKDHW